MSKWSEFIHSFSPTTQPIIEQLIEDASLSIADFDALKALSEAQLKSKLEAASIANPSLIKAFATFFYNGHTDLLPVGNYLTGINGECDETWETYITGYEALWQEVVRGFKADISPVLLADFGQYANLFNPELLPLISEINIDPQLGYPAFAVFKADPLPLVQSKLQALDAMSSFIAQLATLMDSKAAVASDWHTFENGSFPGDENLTLLLTILQQDMTAAGTTFNDFSTFDSGEMATALVTDAPNFLNELATYLVYFRDCTWNHFVSASISELETHIDGFTASSESFIAFAELVLPQAQNAQISATGEYIVKGTIVDLSGVPLVGKKIKVFDKNYKDMVQVGSTFTTNMDGEYGIGFNKADLGDPDKDAPDLEIEVFDTDGTTSLRKAPCVINAETETKMNLAVGSGTYTGMVEFEIMHRKLSRVIGSGDITSDTPCDITNLASRFGFGIEQTSQYFQARIYHQTAPEVSTEVFYGFMREGISTDLGTMMLQPSETLSAALVRAANKNVIGRWYTEEVPAATSSTTSIWAQFHVAKFKSLFAQLALANGFGNMTPLEAHYSNVEHITSTTLSSTQKSEILDVYRDTEGRNENPKTYWENLATESTLSAAQRDALKFSITLASVLQYNVEFGLHLIQIDNISSMTPILSFNTSDWENEITVHNIDIPIGFSSSADYIADIEQYLETAFPNGYLAARLDEQTVIPKTDIITFLNNGDNADFSLENSNLEEYLIGNTSALTGIVNQTQLKKDLAQLMRLYRICPNFEKADVIEALWDEGIKSASQILLLGEASFKKRMEGSLSDDQINVVFRKASRRASVALNMYSNESNKYTNILPAVIPQGIIDSGNVPDGYATMAAEFESGDFCSCQHCQSVFGPAAYLHDLLIWMNGMADSGSTSGKSLLDALLSKRPELDSILLNCDNTNTEIPYIDSIIELLEHMVVKEQSSPNWAPYTDENSFLSRQTTFPSDELKAFPEHMITSAYSSVLSTTAYPWKTSAFDLWFEQWSQFLGYFNLSPYELAKHVANATGGFADAGQIAFRALGITPTQAGLIMYNDGIDDYAGPTLDLPTIYGFADQTEMTDKMFDIANPAPIKVDVLLQRTGLEIEDLGNYLTAKFINPSAKEVFFTSSACDLSKATIDLTAAELIRFYQFYRLHQAFGNSIQDLDYALGNNTSIDEALLIQLSEMKMLANAFSISIQEVSTWYNDIGSHVYPGITNQYNRIFLDELSISDFDSVDALFKLNTSGSQLNTTAADYGTSEVVKSHLLSALSITKDEYTSLTGLVSATRNLGSLSDIYAHISKSRALGIEIDELSTLQSIIGSTSVYSFMTQARDIVASPFSIAETNYLLKNSASSLKGTGISSTQITEVLSLIRTELQATFSDFLLTNASDPKAEIESCIDRFAQAQLTHWQSSTNIDNFLSRIERTVDGGDDALAYTNFKSDLSSLALDVINQLDPLNALLFDSTSPSYIAPSTHLNDRFEVVSTLLRSSILAKPNYYADALEIVVKNMATWLGKEDGLVEQLLTSGSSPLIDKLLDYDAFILKTDDIGTVSAYQGIIEQTEGVFKLATVANKLKIANQHIGNLYKTGSPFSLDIVGDVNHTLQAADIEALINLPSLLQENRFFAGGSDLIEFLVTSHASNTAAQEALVALTGWDTSMVESIGASTIGTSELLKMIQVQSLLKKSGMSYAQLTEWNGENIGQTHADSVTLMVKEKAQQKGSLNEVTEIRDEIRVKQRDALMNYLLAFVKDASNEPAFKDAFDIYDHLLADPEMGTCMPTSRIKFATLSAQLFIQRILLGVEASAEDATKLLKLNKENLEEWEWRENYRVWEANRKVFTYPENWMDPDLRDDKTELFKSMEDALSQIEATSDSVSDIFVDYVEGLDEIANLEIAQAFYERIENILHVFARTKGTQRKYYYRKYIDSAFWTEWKEVAIDIDSNHIIPVIWNERLALLWPTFEEEAKPPQAPKEGDLPKKSRKITLNWSILKGEKWTAPNKSTKSITIPDRIPNTAPLFYKARRQDGALRVSIFHRFLTYVGEPRDRRQEMLDIHVLDEFVFFNGIGTDPIIEPHTFKANQLSNFRTNQRFSRFGRVENQKFVSQKNSWETTHEFDISYAPTRRWQDNIDVNVLQDVKDPLGYSLMIPHQYVGPYAITIPRSNRIPMFFQDSTHTYFVNQTLNTINEERASLDSFGDALTSAFTMDNPVNFNNVSGTISLDLSQSSSTSFNIEVSLDSSFQINASPDGVMYDISIADEGEQLSMAPNQGGNGKPVGGTVDDPDWYPVPDPVALKPLPTAPTKFRFHNFSHPFTEIMLRQLRKYGVKGLLDPLYNQSDESKLLYRQSGTNKNFEGDYSPSTYVVDEIGKGQNKKNVYPKEEFGFEPSDGYSMYNWEVFYHAPIMIATRLMENQKFEEAKVWLEYIFNPNEVDYFNTYSDPVAKEEQTPHRFWKVKPFREYCDSEPMDRIVRFVEGGDEKLNRMIEVWQNNPFSPYAIGRMRPLSFMKKAVMLYLDNLIAWGDNLFARDTMESINEAALLYVNAAKILGKRPKMINRVGNTLSVSQSLTDDMGLFKLVTIEDTLPTEKRLDNKKKSSTALNALNLADFCLPPNDKMFTYWDTVYDRLFKVRNCMNISGLVRKLPLFEPPIDPSILVRAFASGLGVAGALSQIYEKPSPFRYAYLYQKAVEYTNDVKSLGNSILSALEKKDGEELSLLRSSHEINLLNKQLDLKKKSIEEAELGIESIQINKQITTDRHQFYKNRTKRSKQEILQLEKMQVSLFLSEIASTLSGVAGTMSLIPELSTGTAGLGPVVEAMFGGKNISAGLSFGASVLNQSSSRNSAKAGIAGLQAGHQRRDEEWKFQEDTALKELESIDKQMESAQLRLAMAEKEVELQEIQIRQAEEVRVFMEDKFSNQQLYSWMIGKLSKLYFDAYNLAYKMAKKAEKAYFHELGIEQGTNTFVNFGHWDNLKRGLLSGESLHNDLKRLDTAYTENHVREYELTKQFSLSMFNAEQLLSLREKGSCSFDISEMMYDLDHPGHYYRRIKSVSITLPCVAGPFTNISARLTLVKSKLRKSATTTNYQGQLESEFSVDTHGLQSIATSTGQNDSGVFELNFNDSRYLPFEYAGAISSWQLDLPNTEGTNATDVFRQFDYNTISDVIVTVRYMAREGGNPLKEEALLNLKTNINDALEYAASNEGLMRVVSMKSEFPTELHQFISPNSGQGRSTSFELKSKHFPYMFRNLVTALECMNIEAIVKLKDGYSYASPSVDMDLTNGNFSVADVTLTQDMDLELYKATFGSTSDSPVSTWTLSTDTTDGWNLKKGTDNAEPIEAIDDIYFVVKYKKGA